MLYFTVKNHLRECLMNIKELFNYYYDNEIKCPHCSNDLIDNKYHKYEYFACKCLDKLNINDTARCSFFVGKNTSKSFSLIIYYNNIFYYFEEFEDGLIKIRIAKHRACYEMIFSGYLNISFENKFPHFNIEKINTIKLFQ